MADNKHERRSEPFRGHCDGCERRTLQMVRRVSGPWGAATVCSWHEHHEN